MKRSLLSIVIVLLAAAVFMTPAPSVIGDLLNTEKPKAARLETGDWLSKLALRHYGDVSYWRELALVNRAPNPDLIFPEEEVIIPSLAAIRQVREARSLSVVNRLVDEQQAILAANRDSGEQPLVEKPSAETPTEQTSPATTESQAGKANGAVETTSEQAETTAPSGSEEMPAVRDDFGPADEGAQTSDSFFSTPVLTGLAIIGVILLVGAMMFVRNNWLEKRALLRTPSPDKESNDRAQHYWESDSFDLTKHKQASRARKAHREAAIQ